MNQQISLIVQSGLQTGQMFQLGPGSHIIGRTPDNHIQLADPTISKQHARITVQDDGKYFIEDLDSSNGTFVNGQRITASTWLTSGDSVQVGTTVVFGVQGPGGAAPPARASKGRGAIIGVVALIIIAAIGAATWFILQGIPSNNTPPNSAAPATTEPTPTPPETPTSTPAPAVAMEFNVDKTTVQLGQCATLRWQVDNAKEVRLDGEQVVAEGNYNVCPQESSKTYRLTALSFDGETKEDAITLTVPPTPAPPPGVEIEFIADQTTVTYGECTMLRWTVKNAKEVRRDGQKVGLIGTEEVCPTQAGNSYGLVVQTLEGENIEQIVNVVVPPTPVPTATPLPATATPKPQAQSPVIDKFIADQNSLNQGSCTTLRWQVRNAQTVRLDGTQVANQGNQRVCPTASTNTYNLVATGTGGGSVQSSLTLSIIAPTPTPKIIIVQPTPVQPAAPPVAPVVVNACVSVDNDGCYVYRWNVQGIQTLHFNGDGVTSPGQSSQQCTFYPEATLRITHRDGRVEEIKDWDLCN